MISSWQINTRVLGGLHVDVAVGGETRLGGRGPCS